MQFNNKSRNFIPTNSRNIVLSLMLLCTSLLFIGCPPYEADYDYVDTSGRARGVAVHNQYAYIADWSQGLKIFNISNVGSVNQVGAIDLPGLNEQVDVFYRTAVVTDTDQDCIYILDVLDKFNPQIIWTYQTLGKPIAVDIQNDLVYIVIEGENPNSFSGVEVVSCQLSSTPTQISTISIAQITDIKVPSMASSLYVVSQNKLYILGLTQGFINPTPISEYTFSNTENIQSLDFLMLDYIMVFGKSLNEFMA